MNKINLDKSSKMVTKYPFGWHGKSTLMDLTLTVADEANEEMLIQLIQGTEDIRVNAITDVNPQDYLILYEHNNPIAAVKFQLKEGSFEFVSTSVHPMYPENTVTEALYLLLKGWGGRMPLY